MKDISGKVQIIDTCLDDIRDALEDRGVSNLGDITTYADAITSLSGNSTVDHETIIINDESELQAIALTDGNASNEQLIKFWTGTLEEYEALTPDDNTIYNITDDNNATSDVGLNNPFTLLDSKYSEVELDNVSWLKSSGQWNSKELYPSLYEHLIDLYAGNVVRKGINVKLLNDVHTNYDFVINPDNETFRLPLFNGNESIPGKNYYDMELPESETKSVAEANGWVVFCKTIADAQFITLSNLTSGNIADVETSSGTQTPTISIPVAKGDIYQVTYTGTGECPIFRFVFAKGNGDLYYYVGETVQNVNLINAAALNTRINNLQDEYIAADGVLSQRIDNVIDQNRSLIGSLSMPSQKYVDLTLGASGTTYTAPANGYVCISMKGNTNSYYLNIDTHDMYGYNQTGTIVGYSLTQTIPVAKGQSFEILYYNMSLNFFRFIYTEGDK